MKTSGLILCLVTIIFSITSKAQSFQKYLGGIDNEQSHSLIISSDGGFVICGDTRSYGGSDQDAFIMKTDSEGNQLWATVYGNSTNNKGFSVIQTADGGYMVGGGWFNGSTATTRDVHLTKFSSTGNIEWSKKYGGSYDEYARVVRQTSDGGYVYSGYSGSFGAGKFIVGKVDAFGNELWVNTYDMSGNDWPINIEILSNDGLLVVGYVGGSGSNGEIFSLMLDPFGNQIWGKQYNSPLLEVTQE